MDNPIRIGTGSAGSCRSTVEPVLGPAGAGPGAGFERLTTGGNIVLAACWAHARRKFYDVQRHQVTVWSNTLEYS